MSRVQAYRAHLVTRLYYTKPLSLASCVSYQSETNTASSLYTPTRSHLHRVICLANISLFPIPCLRETDEDYSNLTFQVSSRTCM